MTIVIVVEDDTGLENANSYISADEFATYHLDRGRDTDNYDAELVSAALVEGSSYADLRWGIRAKSRPLVGTQGLEFPRAYLSDRYGNQVGGVPSPWKEAVNIYALKYLEGVLYVTPKNNEASSLVGKKTVVGPITTEKRYNANYVAPAWLEFPHADRLAKQYTQPRGGVMRN